MSGQSLSYPTAPSSLTSPELLGVDFDGITTNGSVSLNRYSDRQHAPGRAGALNVATYETIKRGLDILLSAFGLIISAPFFALIALAIKIQDGGPVFYSHDRVGKDGRVFRFHKFRSMVRDADKLKDQLAALNEHGDHRTFKMKRDPRVTFVGRILRRTSLDELPQLFNILKGDMSLVGPRPALPREVALYTPHDRRRLEVIPGLTCLWQVQGRAKLPFSEQVRLDIEYIETRSLSRDLEILVATIPAVILGRGAY